MGKYPTALDFVFFAGPSQRTTTANAASKEKSVVVVVASDVIRSKTSGSACGIEERAERGPEAE